MKMIKVTSKGQVTLPRDYRLKLGIAEGTYLEATVFQDGILLKPASSSSDQIREHCKRYTGDQDSLEKARQVLSKVPCSLSEQTLKLRDE